MSFVIIDRRLNDKGKSSVNRQKFIRQVKRQLKDGIKQIVTDANLDNLISKGGKKVTIPIKNLDEPSFHHNDAGIYDMVRSGNDRFVPGDRIERPEEGAGSGATDTGEGTDDFVFHLTRDEFLDLFFETCELPDFIKKNMVLINEEMQRVGMTNDGSPSMLNIVRSMRQAKSRRTGLRAAKRKKLAVLEQEEHQLLSAIEILQEAGKDCSNEQEILKQVQHDILALKLLIKAVPFIDPVDLRFNSWAKVVVPTTQAVMFCAMDVSGSMDEVKKRLAKTFYFMLHLFLERNYEHIDMVFVRYHSHAQVVDEKEFYYGVDTGGTVASTAIERIADIIQADYPPQSWNVYVAHASDGDNFGFDNTRLVDLLTQRILPHVQFYAYIQINIKDDDRWGKPVDDPDNLWNIFKPIADKHSNVGIAMVESERDVYGAFIKLFERQQ